ASVGRSALGQPAVAMLGGGLGSVVHGSDSAVNGGHVDAGALGGAGLQHGRDLVAHAVEDTIEVNVDDALPVGNVDFSGGRGLAANASIVDGIVQLAEGLEGEVDGGLILLGRSAIHDERSGLVPARLDLVDDALGRILADVRDDDLRAERSEVLCNRFTDARTTPGDQGNFTLKRHISLLVGVSFPWMWAGRWSPTRPAR